MTFPAFNAFNRRHAAVTAANAALFATADARMKEASARETAIEAEVMGFCRNVVTNHTEHDNLKDACHLILSNSDNASDRQTSRDALRREMGIPAPGTVIYVRADRPLEGISIPILVAAFFSTIAFAFWWLA